MKIYLESIFKNGSIEIFFKMLIMDKKGIISTRYMFTGLLIFITSFSGYSQEAQKEEVKSITRAELRDHIYYLASDWLGGRVGASAEYEIAARYVASQFASGGVEPLINPEGGEATYLQGVPFMKTTYGEDLKWILNTKKGKTEFLVNQDFKILFSQGAESSLLDVVFAGYCIEEPDAGWNDFDGIDISGKMVICLPGAPEKEGKPVLPDDLHEKYSAMGGLQSKFGTIMEKNPAVVVMVSETAGIDNYWNNIKSNFSSERYIYKGPARDGNSHGIPVFCFVRPALLESLFENQKYNPIKRGENGLKGYNTYQLKNVTIETVYPVLSEEKVNSSNVVGIVRGTDPELADEYIVVGAHLDHVAPVNGDVCNGADDNASGTSGVIEIAEAVAANPFRRPVIFVAYTAEEMGLYGSQFLIDSEIIPGDKLKFNLNMDMIGRSDSKNEESRAHYVVTNKKYVAKLESFINEINNGVTDFPLLFDNDEDSPGGSDHQSFINEGIPAFFFFSGIHSDLHQPGDDADKIDYAKVESIARLAYLITEKLANADRVPDFE